MAPAPSDRPLARQLEELAAVHESLRALTSTLEFPDILRAVLDRIKAFTAAEGLSLLLYDPERDELVFAATETLAENALVGRAERGADRAARQAAGTGGAVLADDGRILAVPLPRTGKAIGAVEIRARHEMAPFTPGDAHRVQRAADAAFAGIDPKGLSRDAGALAGFFAGLAASVPNEAASLVLLDDLKSVNDRYGHLSGDQVLRNVADIVRGGVRKIDVAARYGGDEFVALLPETDPTGGWVLAEKIRLTVAEQGFAGVEPQPTVSVGVVSYPADGRSADALLVSADRAMYASKRGGKNRVARATAEPMVVSIEGKSADRQADRQREADRAG